MSLTALILAVIFLVCIMSSRISSKWGVPSLLIFIAVGIIFGSDGIFKIPFDNFNAAEQLCSFALIFIMFYGGFGTNWKAAKPVAVQSMILSSAGVVVTAMLTGVFCHFALKMSWLNSMLTGAVISSTDAASVFSILRSKKLNLRYNTASLLEIESGSNDPASYMMTIIVLSLMENNIGGWNIVYMIFSQLVYGAVAGIIIALIAVFALNKFKFSFDGFDALFVAAIAVVAYALPSVVGGNGYLSAYIAGIILGNSKVDNKITLVHFFDGVNGLSQIAIFFLLGLLAFPSSMPAVLAPSIAIALFLTFIARPAAVFMILTPFKCSFKQMLLVSFAGLRGAASIVFAIMAVSSGHGMKYDLFHIVFCVSLLSVAFQGSLLPKIAKILGMVDEENGDGVLKTFTDYQEQNDIQLIEIKVGHDHPWIGMKVYELKLTGDILLVMVKRGDKNIMPNGYTIINEGDILLVSGKSGHTASDIDISQINIDASHSWVGKKIRDIEIAPGTLILSIKKPDGSTIIPKGQSIISEGDKVVISSSVCVK